MRALSNTRANNSRDSSLTLILSRLLRATAVGRGVFNVRLVAFCLGALRQLRNSHSCVGNCLFAISTVHVRVLRRHVNRVRANY